MKDDTISRQAALDAIDTWPKYGCNPDGRLVPLNDDEHYVPYVHYDDMVKVLKSLPTAQPPTDEWCTDCKEYDQKNHCCPRWNRVIRQTLAEAQPQRMRGRWEISSLTRGPMRYCSECGFGQYVEDERVYSFCPNCGAQMDGGKQE